MKCITLLLDGASDRTYKELGNLTPLAYAKTPNLDTIASQSQCGLMTPLSEGLALGTDLAHFLMFGYKLSDYPNRSVIDAIGEGLEMKANELYLRASFASVDYSDGYYLKERFTPDFTDDEVAAVIGSLSMTINDYNFRCVHSYDSHCFIIVTGDKLSDRLSDSDPFRKNSYVMAVEAFESDDKNDHQLADAINTFIKASYRVLSDHDINKKRLQAGQEAANIIMTKWAGMYHQLESFYERNGLSGVLLGQSNLLYGLSSYIGMDFMKYDNLKDAIGYAKICDFDYVHLHTKDPDTAAHKKDVFEKVSALEAIDKQLEGLLDFEGLLIVTSDHSTPCAGLNIHSGESVAFMARGIYIRQDKVDSFDEVACSKGSLFMTAGDYMNYIINATDRAAMYHLRQGHKKRSYVLDKVNRLL